MLSCYHMSRAQRAAWRFDGVKRSMRRVQHKSIMTQSIMVPFCDVIHTKKCLRRTQQFSFVIRRSLQQNINNCKSRKFSLMRQHAELEDYILSHIYEHIKDPILNIPLRDLNWLRGPYILHKPDSSSSSIQIILRMSTKLHPKLDDLIASIRSCVKSAIQKFYQEQNQLQTGNVDWDVEVQLQLAPPKIKEEKGEKEDEREKRLGPGLMHISNFVAVYSCKGGVGKSTIAANLAYSLAKMGGRVGLLDVDVYGPSLPVLVNPTDPAVRRSSLGEGMIIPISHEGVKLLSLGFVSPKSGVPGSGPESSGAAVMRGPMASSVVTQLLKGTEWGELDVLLLDMPPGTGDVQLTICQDLQLNGAVSVTTPSKLAVADAVKGIEMFDSLGIPTLAAVENMAYFECEGGGKHYPFGKGIDAKSLSSNLTISNTNKQPPVICLPISEATNSSNDSGTPITLLRPPDAQKELAAFDELAKSIAESLLRQQYKKFDNFDLDGTSSDGLSRHPTIEIHGEKWDISSLQLSADMVNEKFTVRLYSDRGAIELEIYAEDLRLTNPKTGVIINDPSEIVVPRVSSSGCGSQSHSHSHDRITNSKDSMVQHHNQKGEQGVPRERKRSGRRLFPVTIEKRGYYGYAVEWADGATIIYSMSSIANAAANSSTRLESFLG